MATTGGVRLAELLAALSIAGDLGNGLGLETGLRCCVIATRLTRLAGFEAASVGDAYYGGLLRYIGCPSTSFEEAAFDGDDLRLRATLLPADFGDPLDVAKRAAQTLGKGKGAVRRAQTVARFLAGAAAMAPAITIAHCEVGARLAARLGLPSGVSGTFADFHERFDGRGMPHRRPGKAISPVSRALSVASTAALHFGIGGRAAAREVVRRRSGGELDPELAAVFLGHEDDLLGCAERPSLWDVALREEPAPERIVPKDRFEEVARVFADFADLKSPFTLGHSPGVARLAEAAAGVLHLGIAERTKLRHAALFHDLGRVSVPNGIWDKRGPLDAGERMRMQMHAPSTRDILVRSETLAPLGELASMAHERLDRSGYFRSVSAAGLPTAARLLAAADVCHALGEPRPHRRALTPREVGRVLTDEVTAGRLDWDAVRAVIEARGGEAGPRLARHPSGLTDREIAVLRRVALGLSAKEIAAELRISRRTAEHQTQHV